MTTQPRTVYRFEFVHRVDIDEVEQTLALSILAVDDLMKVVNRLNSVTFRTIELYTASAVIYTLLGVALGALAYLVERNFSRQRGF